MTAAAVLDPRALRPAALLLVAGAAGRGYLFQGAGLPCPLRSLTGVPCPLCGMSTSVTAVARFDVNESLLAAPAGLVVAALALLALSGVWRRPLRVRPWVVLVAVAMAWVWQLARMSLA